MRRAKTTHKNPHNALLPIGQVAPRFAGGGEPLDSHGGGKFLWATALHDVRAPMWIAGQPGEVVVANAGDVGVWIAKEVAHIDALTAAFLEGAALPHEDHAPEAAAPADVAETGVDAPAGDGGGSGELVANVWDVLADTQAEATNLKARAALLTALLVQVRGWHVTQAEAARRLGLTRPRLNDLMRGKLHKFSLDALVNLMPAAGLELDLGSAIRPAT